MASSAALVPEGSPITLDEEQAAVVGHRRGALLVRSRPGTGATTAIVEAVAARLEGPEAPPADGVLVLAFGRGAVARLRTALAARIGAGALPRVATIHALAHDIVGRWRAASETGRGSALRLLSGAEEDARIRDLLRGAVEDGDLDWPDSLAPALPTLGLANEVRAVLAAMRARGLAPADLRHIAAEQGRPVWATLADFAAIEAEVMALEDIVDYAGLLDLAVAVAADPEAAQAVPRFQAVYVDNAEEIDPLQAQLIRALVGPGGSCVLAGDPDQAIYGFRGSDRGAMADLGAALGAARVDLRTPWRAPIPPAVAALVRSAAERPAARREAGDVAVHIFDGPGDLAAHVAADLAEHHLSDRTPWSRMAVLVRSSRQLPALRRGLEAAGVPVVVEADEIPLIAEPAVAVLLAAVEAAIRPGSINDTEAWDLLVGPLAAIDPVDLRALARRLRAAALAARPGQPMPTGARVLADLLLSPTAPPAPDDPVAARVRQVHGLLASIAERAEAGASPVEVLWQAWSFDDAAWPRRLRAAALVGQRQAGRDLDSIAALLDTAERLTARYAGVLGTAAFLAMLREQRLPAEAVAARSVTAGVRLLTVHHAKGREWDVVVVVGLQEEAWPVSAAGVSVLGADRLAEAGHRGVAERLLEERRLLYVALTRARRSTTVAVVASAADRGEQPSRFVTDLLGADAADLLPADAGPAQVVSPAGVIVRRRPGRPTRPRTLDGWVAELRTLLDDPATPGPEREAAASALAWLARAVDDDGRLLAPAADPDRWWGVLAPTPGAAPLRPAAEPVELSASAVDAILECPLRWFLDREAHAQAGSHPAAAVGTVIHALAEAIGRGLAPADVDALNALVDRVWPEVGFAIPWQSAAEREAARDVVARLVAYVVADHRHLAATELSFAVPAEIGLPVRLRGMIDRVEVDSDGVHLIDLKTSAQPPSQPAVDRHRQLALYQLAARLGALDGVVDPGTPVADAALVQLRTDAGPPRASPGLPKVQVQDAQPDEQAESGILADIRRAAETIRAEDIRATPGYHCRTCPYRRLCPAKTEELPR